MSIEMQDSKVMYETESDDIPVKVVEKPKHEPKADFSDSVRDLMGQERFWAALAHAIGPVMIALAIFGDGIGWLGLMLVTTGIYVYHRDKSELVTRHAQQALAAQIAGTFGWLALFISGTIIWVILLVISIVLILVLVGIILTPLVAVAYPIFVLLSFALPLGLALFGGIGAWETWHGRDFRYPYVTDWVDQRFGNKPRRQIITV